jgi:hypothetical protein
VDRGQGRGPRGYYEGPLDAAGSVYTVEKVNGKWKITGEKLEEIA